MRLTLLVTAVMVLAGCASVQRPDTVEPPPADAADENPFAVDPEAAYDRISVAVTLGNPQQAIEEFQAAELADPESPATRVLLANLYLAAGEIDQAEALLTDIVEQHPEEADALYSLALVARARGQTDRERELLEAVVALDPAHAGANASLGELALRDRRLTRAEEAFVTTLEQEPNNLVALVGLANLRMRSEEPEIAEELLDRAIEAAPEYSFAYADRSRARAMQQELGAAEEDLSRALELDPDYSWHFFDRGRVRLERNDLDGAIADLNEAITRDPDIFLTYVLRARAHDRLGDRDASIADYRSALELRTDYFPAYAPLAVLYFEDQRYGDAARWFARAWGDAHPNDPKEPAWALAAALSWKLADETDRAESFLEDAAGEFPRPGIYWDLARYYLSPGYDGPLFRAVTEHDDRVERIRASFYLAAHYEFEDRINTARALYMDIADEDLPGFAESRLAEHRLARMRGDS